MGRFTRRDSLKTLGAGVASAALPLGSSAAQAVFPPEKGAKLRVLRWKRFVQGDEELWNANSRRFSEQTGVEVRVDAENFEELRPKAAVAANVGAGPDIVIGSNEDALMYPDKLIDVSDVAQYLGQKYGGWYDVCREYATHEGKWIAIPTGAAGGATVYRESHVKAAGFEQFPGDMAGMLKLCRALKAKGTPPGFALGHATGDATALCTWALWGHGGKLASDKGRITLDAPETIAALEYVKELYATFIPGTLSWLDPSNNKAFLAGEISLTFNGISIYYSAKNALDEKTKAMAADIKHATFPVGPIGRPIHGGLMFPAWIYKYSKYPNAAKEYLRFMMEKEPYQAWQSASIGYVSHTLKGYEESPIWRADPQHMFYRDVVKNMRTFGYAGKVGKQSASVFADFVLVDMFAEVCAGKETPKAAAQRAQKRAERFYRT